MLTVRPGMTSQAFLRFGDEQAYIARDAPDDVESYYLTRLLPEKLAIELDYVRNWSVRRDLEIIFRTFKRAPYVTSSTIADVARRGGETSIRPRRSARARASGTRAGGRGGPSGLVLRGRPRCLRRAERRGRRSREDPELRARLRARHVGPGVFVGPAAVLTADQHPRAVEPDGRPKGRTDWKLVGVVVREGASLGPARSASRR